MSSDSPATTRPTARPASKSTRTALCIETLQAEWRRAMGRGDAEGAAKIAGLIQRAQRVRIASISTRISLADISAAVKRMEER